MATQSTSTASQTAAKTTEAAAKTETPVVDLNKALIAALKAEGIKPEVRWAPSNNYASLLVKDVGNIGYVFKQTRNGIRIEPAATKADLPKGAKGYEPGTRSALFALVGVFTEATIKDAVVGLKAANAKAVAAVAEKAAAEKAAAAAKAAAKKAAEAKKAADAQKAADAKAAKAADAPEADATDAPVEA